MWHDDLNRIRKYIQRKMEELEEEIDTLLGGEQALLDEEYMNLNIKEPLHTIYDAGSKYIIIVDLPWVDPAKILVNAVDNKIEVKAKLKRSLNTSELGYKFASEVIGEYQKTITIPSDSNVSELNYTIKHGRLVIEVPKNK